MIRLIYISWYDIPSTWTIMHGWWWCWYNGYVWFIGVSFRFLLVWTLNVLKGEWLHKAQRDRVIYGDTEVSITRGTCLVLASPDERVVTIHLARTATNLAMVPSALVMVCFIEFDVFKRRKSVPSLACTYFN